MQSDAAFLGGKAALAWSLRYAPIGKMLQRFQQADKGDRESTRIW
jgi:hypothetical protein